jgi:hypothetical protein
MLSSSLVRPATKFSTPLIRDDLVATPPLASDHPWHCKFNAGTFLLRRTDKPSSVQNDFAIADYYPRPPMTEEKMSQTQIVDADQIVLRQPERPVLHHAKKRVSRYAPPPRETAAITKCGKNWNCRDGDHDSITIMVTITIPYDRSQSSHNCCQPFICSNNSWDHR